MESILFLDENAYEYLAAIPPHHWSRHAFPPNSKSNMLLNNLCETFNAVIREARDKPILTQMEWMRRYLMKRNNQKWEAVKKLKGKNMPYIKKVFDGIEVHARSCIVQVSRDDTYEVQLKGDQVLVDLASRTCTCYQWDLTGIPCVHAFACLMDKRANPDDYVHEAYSKATYILAYEHAIKPMPGQKYWQKMNMREPLPPQIRIMPGRPKAHKRKKEKGEEEAGQAKRPKKPINCGKCGQQGHNRKSCKNAPAPAATGVSKGVGGRPPIDTPWVKDQRKKREARVMNRKVVILYLSFFFSQFLLYIS